MSYNAPTSMESRKTWKISPRTHVKESAKIYKRRNTKQQLKRTEDEEDT